MYLTVKQACTLNEGALHIRINDAIEHIGQETLQEEEGRKFLKQSYLTHGMQELVKEGFKRLSGTKGGHPVFRLKQAMGGGKTHLIKTMAFLARHPVLRSEFFSATTSQYNFGAAQVTFFNGREQPNDFFWGRIASELGHPQFFAPGAQAPGLNHWNELFAKLTDPALIMLDEMPPYFAYYRTQQVGAGTIADVVQTALSNLMVAAQKCANVCVIITDLDASHADGTAMINSALENAKLELGRTAFNITPVDLAGDETYAILKKRLFAELPDENQIRNLAQQFAKSVEQAQRSRQVNQQKTPEQIAAEIEQTYPFHPQMKHIFSLFKENKEFQQTRGLMELASRLLNSAWSRKTDDVLLIGPQHFDLSIEEVRGKVEQISRLEIAVSRDIYGTDGSAHAQIIDANTGNDAATQVANLLLISSMSTALNPVKGLTKSETLECLAAPNVDLSFFEAALEDLQKSAWYMHKTGEGRIYFDKLENLTKMLAGLAERAPDPKVNELIANRLTQMYEPRRKSAYSKVLALPKIDDIQAAVATHRVLAIVPPNSNLPPEEIGTIFSDGITRRNNLLVLSGERSFEMGKLQESARMVYAAEQAIAQRKIEPTGPQWADFQELQKQFELSFTGVIKTLFDKLLYPFHVGNGKPMLQAKNLEQAENNNDGEARVENTLTKDPLKLYLDWQDATKFNAVRSRVERLFGQQDEASWSDIKDKAQTDCSMYFLPQGDLERLKTRACNEGKWEDLGNGQVTKKPQPKQATVQVSPVGRMDDKGYTTLAVSVLHAKPATTRIHYAEDGEVTEASPRLTDDTLKTNALRVAFLAVDSSGQCPSAPPYIWTNKLLIQWDKTEPVQGERTITLKVLPKHDELRYTLNGVEPRNGTNYTVPFKVDGQGCKLLVFAQAGGLEAKAEFTIPTLQTGPGPKGGPGPEPLPLTQPVSFPTQKNAQINARDKVFAALAKAQERQIRFTEVDLRITEGSAFGQFAIAGQTLDADQVLQALQSLVLNFQPTTPVVMGFRAQFQTGQDLQDFAQAFDLNYAGQWSPTT